MSDFTENIRTAYELYLLGKKEEAFELLIPGTKHHYYLSIIDAFKKEGSNLSEDTHQLITNFKENYSDQDVTRVSLQELFLKYDNSKTDKEKQELINELDTKYIHCYFNHVKPADVKEKKDSASKETRKDTQKFDQSASFNEESVLSDIYKNNDNIYNLHKLLHSKLDFKKIGDNVFMQFIGRCSSFADLENKTFFEKLVDSINQLYKKNKLYSPDSTLYDKFTLDQLEMLGEKLEKLKADSHYIGKIFEKRFHFELDNENRNSFTLEERREQLVKMYEASSNRPQSFKSALLLEILENGVKLDIFDKNYFIEYLQNPLKTWLMNKDTQKKKEIHNNIWSQYIFNMHNRQGGIMDQKLDKKLFKKYLEQFYNQSGSIEEFGEYFDQDFLLSLSNEFDFFAGKEIKVSKVNTKEAEQMTSMVLIDLLESNKEVFKKEDRVRLVTEIKNVATLHIKIFEFNSENYYRKNLAPFRTDVNLDGLITAHEETHEFKEPAQKKFRYVFEFPQLDDKIGLFVIEFISNGYSSRAVIKKGSLSLIYKSTVAGQVAYILDENKDICKTSNTGMWYKNSYYKADTEKGGRIIIPYQKQESSGSAILIYDGFAQLAQFRQMAENYSFDCSYVAHPESMLMGREAEILLKPSLKVNSRK
jgi:hypothetical protein